MDDARTNTEQTSPLRLQNRVCVIAGAGGEIGPAVARRLQDEGAMVVGVDREPHSTGDLQLVADLADEPAVAALFDDIFTRFGRLDVLYNNAGAVDDDDHSAIDMSLELWHRIFADNLTATLLTCKHAIPYMLRDPNPGGSVINTSSFLAEMGAATSQMAFSAAKAAVAQLSRDLATHLARRGVRVNALSLGPIMTPQLSTAFAQAGRDQLARRLSHMPMGRFGTLAELASAVAFLASDESGFITGSLFPINGGIPTAFTVPPEDNWP